MYPTSRKSVSLAKQTTMYPYTEASSACNTVHHYQSSKDHIYESTFAPAVTVVMTNVKANDDETSEPNYFVSESNIAQSD